MKLLPFLRFAYQLLGQSQGLPWVCKLPCESVGSGLTPIPCAAAPAAGHLLPLLQPLPSVVWGGDIWDSPATSSCPRASCLPWPFRSPGWQQGRGPHFSAFQIPGSPEGCPPYQSKQEEKCNVMNNPGIRLWVAMGNRDPNKQEEQQNSQNSLNATVSSLSLLNSFPGCL